MPTAPTAVTMPIASPRLRVNHNATDVVAVRFRAPCPIMRMPIKPAVRPTMPDTKDIAIKKAPKSAPTMIMTRRTPYRSIACPIHGNASAPTRVPIRYDVVIVVREMPRSSIIGFTKTETPNVWPGPVRARAMLAYRTTRQP